MANELAFRISAIDNASKVSNKVGDSFSRIGDRAARMSGRLTSIGKTGATALGKITSGLNSISQGARAAADRISSIIPGMSALVGLAGAAGVGALAQRWGDLGSSLQRTSRQVGMSTRGLQAWHYAAKRAGVTAEQFDQSMLSSQNTIREAAFGANPQAVMLLSRLGVRISRGKDGQIDYERTQHDIMTALGKIKNPAGQRTAADALGMGALLPMIQRGTFDADRAEAGKRGYIFGEEAIERALAFQDKINGLKASTGALANTIGDKLIPVLTPMIEKLTSWLDENRVNIADRLAEAVGKLTSWITSIDWGAWYDRVNKIADTFGGWGNVLAGIVAIKFAATMAEWGVSLAALVASLTAAKAAATALQATAAAGAAGAAGAGAAAAGAPWYARILNPYAVGAGALFYSKDLNAGEDATLASARRAQGKSYLTPGEYAPGGTNDPKILDIAQKFMGMGWSKEQAAGIAANILQESGGNPYSVGDGGKAYGIGQWHPDRQEDFKRVFKRDIRDSTLEDQLKFFDWELRNGPGQQRVAGDLLARATSANRAAAIVSQYHERPADVEGEKYKRGIMADRILGAMGGGGAGSAQAANPALGAAAGAPGMGNGPGFDGLKDALDASLQKLTLQVNVSAPPGTRVDTNSGDGAGMSARVNYSMGLGAMP
ncbi:phage tail tip lysozyme [Achromobacter xylosoxidans]|uniref:phage tail tip lysozyme n=1 Tax=Alcaligenes xylosoxydans xylosoxydans TaxID=85698 RepID=UPI002A7483CB|nr:phage tail tip lysozyme [Achromobacter xylosoxidans]WPQ37745.1 phage tail tip lysozyme [Achromobacter xylosoxidans]